MRGAQIRDLAGALDLLEATGQLLRISAPTESRLEVARRYADFAGVPAARPTGTGPALVFDDVRPSRRPVAVGVFGTRQRCLDLVGCHTAREFHDRLLEGVKRPVAPVDAVRGTRVAVEPTMSGVPVPTVTSDDAGPYVTLGLVRAYDPDNGLANNSIHRICVQSERELTIWIVPGRDLGQLAQRSWDLGEPLPIAIHVGLDPAVYLATCLTGVVAPFGCDELGIAGALRGGPVQLAPADSLPVQVIAHADWVIEGLLRPGPQPESRTPGRGSMPEFLGYAGAAHPGLPTVQITAITTSREPVWQTVVGPGAEQSNLLAFGMETELLQRFRSLGIEEVVDVHASSAGGGQLLVFVQAAPTTAAAKAALKEATVTLLREMRMVKTAVLVEEDVDLDDHADLWWSVTTRMQPARDVTIIENAPGFPLDPSQSPEFYSPLAPGTTSKMLIDTLVPDGLRPRFQRPPLGR